MTVIKPPEYGIFAISFLNNWNSTIKVSITAAAPETVSAVELESTTLPSIDIADAESAATAGASTSTALIPVSPVLGSVGQIAPSSNVLVQVTAIAVDNVGKKGMF